MTHPQAERSIHRQSLYRQVLGRDWDRLPAAIRAVHETSDGYVAFRGRATVERGQTPLARLAAFIAGFPAAGKDVPVEVHFACSSCRETWNRRFGDKVLRSSLQKVEKRKERLLAEDLGPFRILCSLAPEADRLHLKVRGWSVLGLPLPLFLAPGGRTFEEDRGGVFHFHVEVESPLTGLIVRYRGWLEPAAPIKTNMPARSDSAGALTQD